MSDSPFDAQDYPPEPWPPSLQLIEHLWAIRKDGRRYDAELRDHGQWGVELQFLLDLELLYGRRWPTRELAIAEADARKAQFLGDGGILVR